MSLVTSIPSEKYQCRKGHIHETYHGAYACSERPSDQQEREFESRVCGHCRRQWYSPEFQSTGCGVTEDCQGWMPTATRCMKFNEERNRVECDEYIPGGELYRRWGGRKVKDPKPADVCSPQEMKNRKGKKVGLSIVGWKEYK